MPIYEYRWEKCGYELEAVQKIGGSRLMNCPVCDADALKKRFSAAGFCLKVGGGYETDIESGKKKNVSGSESSSSSTSSSNSSSEN